MGQIGLPAAHPTPTGRRFTGGWWCVVALARMVGVHGMAQEPAPWPIPKTIPPRFDRELAADHTVRAWRQTDGLPSDQVTCLVQSSDGYLWVGTTAGLARFDGVRFVRFDHGNVPQLVDHRIRALAEDGAGNLWVVTGDHQLVVLGEWGWSLPGTGTLSVDGGFGLQTQDDGSVMGHLTMGRLGSWMPSPGAPRMEVRWDLPEDTLRVLEGSAHPRVLVTHEELRIGRPGEAKERRYRFAPQTQRNPMAQTLVRAVGDSAWLLRGVYGGSQAFELFRISGNQVAMIDDSVPHPRSFSPSIATDHAGGVWHAAGSGYIGHATTTERIRYRLPGTDQEVFPLGLVRGLGASIWAAVENAGLLEIRPRRFQSIRDTEGLPHAMVRCVVPDTRGGVWAGTENGVARLQAAGAHGEWQAIPSGLEGHTVRALQLGNDGTLWAGSSRGLFARQRSEWASVPLPRLRNGASDGDGLGSLKVRDLLAGRGGEVWTVAAHQVAVAPEPGGAMSTVAFLPNAGPTDMLEDHTGHRWLATERAGVLVLGPDSAASVLGQPMEPVPGFPGDQWRWKPSAWLRETNGLPSDHVWEMLEDSDRDLWMLGPRGLLRLPRNTARSLVVGTGIPNGPDAAPFVFTTHHGLPELALNTLADDGQGNLWLGGDQGAYRIPRASLHAVARGASTRLSVETFTVADGLPADETNGRISHPGVVRDGEGRIWMSTVRGLACLRPEPQTGFDDGRGVAIEEVRADGWILATTLPQDPEGGRVGAEVPNQARRNPEEGMPVRRLSRPVVVQPGRGRVLEIRFTGFDPTAPRALRFRYQIEGYENSIHEVGDRRVVYFTNLDPGTYHFRVWASGHSGVWMARPAELGITLLPEFWETRWFQVLVGLSAAGVVAGGVTLRVRRIRQLEELRRRADRTDLRNRLARDLHDGVGSGLARLALLAHLPEDDARHPDRVARQFRDLAGAVQELAQTVREIAWSARPSAISLESLMAQIAQQTGEFLGAAGIRCRTSLPLEFPALELEPEPRLDLYFAAKEAVTNIVRHSHATDARLDVELRDGLLILSLWDNGCGLAVSARETPTDPASGGGGGNGLPNLKARLECLGGRVVVGTGNVAPAQGTQVRIEVPLKTLGSRPISSD
jgi:signal transduction histidine kinase